MPASPADPAIQAQNRKNDENKKQQRGGAGQRAVCGVETRIRQPGDADGGYGRFQNRAAHPENARKFLIRQQRAIHQPQHGVLIEAERGGEDQVPACVAAQDRGVQQENANG